MIAGFVGRGKGMSAMSNIEPSLSYLALDAYREAFLTVHGDHGVYIGFQPHGANYIRLTVSRAGCEPIGFGPLYTANGFTRALRRDANLLLNSIRG